MINVFVMLGNSDNKLGQDDWALLIEDMRQTLRSFPVISIRGEFFSPPDIRYQNACWHITVSSVHPFFEIKKALTDLAKAFNQDSIGWIEGKETEFLG